MKNKKLWEAVSKRVDELNIENEDIKTLTKVNMYTATNQEQLLNRIQQNVVFLSWILIIGLGLSILIGLVT